MSIMQDVFHVRRYERLCGLYLQLLLTVYITHGRYRANVTSRLHAAVNTTCNHKTNVTFRKINLLPSQKQCQKNTEDSKRNCVLMADRAGMTELCWSRRTSSKRTGFTSIFSDIFFLHQQPSLDFFLEKFGFNFSNIIKRVITFELGGLCNISNYRSSRWRCCGFGQFCFNYILKIIQCWKARQTSIVKKHGQ